MGDYSGRTCDTTHRRDRMDAMVEKVRIEISEEALAAAEKGAAETGLSSANEYIEALLTDDCDAFFNQSWVGEKIDQGLASPDAGQLTREFLSQIVQEGLALAKRGK